MINNGMAMLKVLALIVVIALQTGCKSAANEFYVSQSGDDANSGTKESPLRSIQKLNTLVLKPGDKVLLKGGDMFEGTLSLTLEGEIGKPIIITSYDNEKDNAVIFAGNSEGVLLGGRHFQFTKIDVKGSGRKEGNTSNGITIVDATDALLEHVTVEGFQKSGVELKSCKNTEVKKVVAMNNGFCGIYITGSNENRSRNILVKDSRAENNPGDPTMLENHSGNGILASYADSVLIDHCVATNNGWDMPRVGNGPVGIWAFEASYVTFQYCISYGNKTSKGGKDGGGFDFDGGVTNSVIQYCLSYDNEGAGYGLFQFDGASLWYNNIVRYCLSINDAVATEGAGGIFVWNGSHDSVQLADCHVYNNVVYATHAPAVEFEPASLNKNFNFYNNIFIGTGEIVRGPSSGEKFQHNVWWHASKPIKFRGYNSLAAWSAATGQELIAGSMSGMQVDPLLKGPLTTGITDPYRLHELTGYTLQAGSSIRNMGTEVKPADKIPPAPHDFFGNPVVGGGLPDPGIHKVKE